MVDFGFIQIRDISSIHLKTNKTKTENKTKKKVIIILNSTYLKLLMDILYMYIYSILFREGGKGKITGKKKEKKRL